MDQPGSMAMDTDAKQAISKLFGTHLRHLLLSRQQLYHGCGGPPMRPGRARICRELIFEPFANGCRGTSTPSNQGMETNEIFVKKHELESILCELSFPLYQYFYDRLETDFDSHFKHVRR